MDGTPENIASIAQRLAQESRIKFNGNFLAHTRGGRISRINLGVMNAEAQKVEFHIC